MAVSGLAIITEACIDIRDRSCVDVCPVGAIYPEESVPDGSPNAQYNAADPHKGHDHSYFIEHSRAVFAD